MTRPTTNTHGMEMQIRRCALSMIPLEATAVIRRNSGAARDALGALEEGESGDPLSWDVPAYESSKRGGRGQWGEAGMDARSTRKFSIGRPIPDDPAFAVEIGDRLLIHSVEYKIVTVERQPVDEDEYWNVDAERVIS